MNIITTSYKTFIFGLSFLLLLFIGDGCGKDSSSPASTGDPAPHSTYPTVAKDWTGTAYYGSSVTYPIVASLYQVADSIINGTCTYHVNVGKDVTVTYHGSITTVRQIFLGSPPSQSWTIENITATLSTGADTISGYWWMTDGTRDKIMLVKK